jgi:hypothetical protein
VALLLILRRWFNWGVENLSSGEISAQTLFVFNVRINNQDRADRLFELLQFLGPWSKISLRLRGEFSKDPRFKTLESPQHFSFAIGSTFHEWKLDLLEQISQSGCSHFVLLQEDHLPLVSLESLLKIVASSANNLVDFMPLSFFPQNLPLRDKLREHQIPEYRDRDISSWTLNKEFIKVVNSDLRIYPVSLIGYFSKALLVKILLTERPLMKGYSIDSPFDFEQRFDSTWYFPIKWAFPEYELFACVDDDHGIAGYSLSARTGYNQVQERHVDHHQAGLVLGELPNWISSIKRFFIGVLPSQLLVLPRNLKYTWKSLRGFRRRRRIQKRLLSDF